MTTYGQRGGDGPNTGKTRTTYQAAAPDGSLIRKATFNTGAAAARMYIYKSGVKWYASGVRVVDDWPAHNGGQWVDCTRV
jgi:hypothetical protein